MKVGDALERTVSAFLLELRFVSFLLTSDNSKVFRVTTYPDGDGPMDSNLKKIIWQQFGAAIDMLENAIKTCPDMLWGDRSQEPEFWYLAFHTLFFLDLYLSESDVGFAPPAPFTLDELDERGLLPDRVYSKDELLVYLHHGREKCRVTIGGMTDEQANRRCGFDWLDLTVAEVLLYNMRHVQHHAAQLNLMIRQKGATPPRWVRKTSAPFVEG